MRTFELRLYKLRTKEALDFYTEQIYPRHLSSIPWRETPAYIRRRSQARLRD
jgi:hypothetical protein